MRIPIVDVLRHHPAATFTYSLFCILTVFAPSWDASEFRYSRQDFLERQMLAVMASLFLPAWPGIRARSQPIARRPYGEPLHPGE